ncbi:hypothetical protein L7F22_037813 [Adiantum nelumboides]|nr:hypothetical protein [Adiantum nelumboides]
MVPLQEISYDFLNFFKKLKKLADNRVYEQAMEDNGIQDWEAIDGFHLIVIPELRAQVARIQAHQGAEWQDFKKALKEEDFLEDSQRLKQGFEEMIEDQVETKYKTIAKKKSLAKLLEDASRELGLTSYWKLVSNAVNAVVKQQMRVDQLIVTDSSEASDEEVKDKSATLKHKLEEPILDDLVKGIKLEFEGWYDPVDLLSVYAYIAKSKAIEAWVEKKRKCNEEEVGTSKRATTSSNKKEKVTKPLPEVNMEDSSKDKKQGKPRGPSYKLKSDIEMATSLRKVFEERMLNSKVEMTLGDILGIAKREFHEEIINIIKRKWQIPSDQEP